MTKPNITIASDHRGFPLKGCLIGWLNGHDYTVNDLGVHNETRCDAMDYAVKVAEALRQDREGRGVLICGTGQMTAITANRYAHIRAALCSDVTMARLARQHNDANVLVLGAHIIGLEVALDCLEVFLGTEFLAGRYADRREALAKLGGL